MHWFPSFLIQVFWIILCRGALGALPVPAHLPGVAVGRSSHGLQGPVDAHPLRHFQLFAGKPNHIFIEFLPPRARSKTSVALHLSPFTFIKPTEPLVTLSIHSSSPFKMMRRQLSKPMPKCWSLFFDGRCPEVTFQQNAAFIKLSNQIRRKWDGCKRAEA